MRKRNRPTEEALHDDDSGEGLEVVALALAKREAKGILTARQYAEVVKLVKRLGEFGNPRATSDLEIKPFGDFWELCLKGGFLRRINLRIYFANQSEHGRIVILKAYKKEEDRRVSPHIMTTLEDRLEDYLSGALQQGISVYRKAKS